MNKHRNECSYLFIWGDLDLMKKHLIGGKQRWVCMPLLSQVTLAQTEHHAKACIWFAVSSAPLDAASPQPVLPHVAEMAEIPASLAMAEIFSNHMSLPLVSFVFSLTQKDKKTFL